MKRVIKIGSGFLHIHTLLPSCSSGSGSGSGWYRREQRQSLRGW